MNPISRGIHFFALSLFIRHQVVKALPSCRGRMSIRSTAVALHTVRINTVASVKLDRAARSSAREISVHTNDQRNVVLKYDPRTVVFDRDREFSVVDLRNGDVVRIEPSRGDYVDVIRLIEASRS